VIRFFYSGNSSWRLLDAAAERSCGGSQRETGELGGSYEFRILTGSLVLMLCFVEPVLAQETQQPPPEVSKPPAPVAVVVAPPEKIILKEGADVNLKFAQDLNSKTANDDDPVSLVLDQDIKIGEMVVVKAGAKAVGTITHAKKAGMMGKAGELNMRLDYLITDTGRLRLRGTKGKEGEGKVGATVALTVLFGPIGLIKHGKDVEIKPGTPLLVYTDENYDVPAPKPVATQMN
jgi:biopolymer transport protein ExbD